MTYKVTLLRDPRNPGLREIDDWVKIHCKSHIDDDNKGYNSIKMIKASDSIFGCGYVLHAEYSFENEKDAVLFSLRWL